ncbi:MAG: indole-3-glycerol phosphate synthase TrpC [Proteobacteria bacterium]|nr:indole-3-glycerol phosphate synthase TrpC [Pseudomonadota bacterium]
MILNKIIAAKREEVAYLKYSKPVSELKRVICDLPPPRDFRNALSGGDCSIIAEIKRSSPSRGRLREGFDPLEIASIYEENGAAAISVLTDREFFEGDKTYLSAIKKIVDIPLLRKDFIIDSCQIYETRVLGGDAVLFIVRLLKDEQLREYIQLAAELGLDSLVEVHSGEELESAIAAGAGIIGINNRNLETFSTDLTTSIDLASCVPRGKIVVSESGINTRKDIEILMEAGIHSFLVGEALMRADDIGGKLKELLD